MIQFQNNHLPQYQQNRHKEPRLSSNKSQLLLLLLLVPLEVLHHLNQLLEVPSMRSPPDDPLEEQNIWCEMLLLEGRKTNNRIAEGFVWWLDKNLDSTIHEVKKIYLS